MARAERRRSRRSLDTPEGVVRVCNTCSKTKPLEDFVKSVDRLDGRRHICRLCHQDRIRSRKYNVPLGWYDVMLTKQNGNCAICDRSVTECPKGVLHVDHDHSCCSGDGSCGQCVRGLICGNCNVTLGHVKDNAALLRKLITYLESQERLSQPKE